MPTVAPTRPPVGTRVSRTPSRPPAVEARMAIRGSGRDSASPAARRACPASRPGRLGVEPAASPTTASASPTSDPRIRKSRTYSDAARPAPPIRRVCRIDGDRRDHGDRQPGDARRPWRHVPSAPDERDAGRAERDDEEDDETHGPSSIGWAYGARRPGSSGRPALRAGRRRGRTVGPAGPLAPGRSRRHRHGERPWRGRRPRPRGRRSRPAVTSCSSADGVPPRADSHEQGALQSAAAARCRCAGCPDR